MMMNRMTMNRNGFGTAAQMAARPHLAGDPMPGQAKPRRKPGKLLKFLNKLPFPPVVGGMFAVVGAILALATPLWLMEYSIARSGLPALLPAATPPLGSTARVLVTILSSAGWGIGAFLVLWFGSKILARGSKGEKVTQDVQAPVSQIDDESDLARFATPDLRPAPLSADELGSPLMSDEALDLGSALVLAPDPEAAVPDEEEPLTLDAPFALDLEETFALPEPAQPAVEMDSIQTSETAVTAHVSDVVPEYDMSVEPIAEFPAAAMAPVHDDTADHEVATAFEPHEEPDVAALLQRLEFGLARLQFAGKTKPVPPLGRDALLDRMAAGTL